MADITLAEGEPVALSMFRGDTLVTQFDFQDSDEVARDLTGSVPLLHLRKRPDGGVVYSFAVGTGLEIVEDEGTITWTISKTRSETLLGEYVWDLQVTLADGSVDPSTPGTLRVNADVTHG